MLRLILIAVAAAGLLIAGALTGLASNSHGNGVSHLATSTTLKGEARGDAISTLARAMDQAAAVASRTDTGSQTEAKAETDTDTADEATDDDANQANDEDANDAADQAGASATDEGDAQGDVVSAIAKSDATAAHDNGKKQVNHGGAVSEAAEKD